VDIHDYATRNHGGTENVTISEVQVVANAHSKHSSDSRKRYFFFCRVVDDDTRLDGLETEGEHFRTPVE
jgi:hypothetical protein